MNYCKRLIKTLASEESGQDLIEYALIAAVIGLGAIATLQTLATQLRTILSSISAGLAGSVVPYAP